MDVVTGDYQYRANYTGPSIQRFWHHQRKFLIDEYLRPRAGDHILDAGCGSGVFAHYMGRTGAHVWGLDNNHEAISFARQAFPSMALTFVCAPLHQTGLEAGSIDKILLSEVLEHLPESYQEQVAVEFDRLLAPEGLLLVTTPNYRSLWMLLEPMVDRLQLLAPLREQHVVRTSKTFLKQCALNRVFERRTLGYFNYVSPVLALLNWHLAEFMAGIERHLSVPGGLQLFAVWQKAGRVHVSART